MKFAILFIFGVAIAAAVGAGAVHLLRPVSDEDVNEKKIEALDAEIGEIRAGVEKSKRDMAEKIGSLDADVAVLSERLEALGNQFAELKKAGVKQAAVPEKGTGAEAAPAGIEELVDKIVKEREEERQKERQEQRAGRMAGMQQMMQGMINTRLNEFAKKKNWNITKQEEVKGIIDSSMKKAGELFRELQGGGPPSPETFEKIREIMEETEVKLKEVMTEEEWKEFQESMPGPGMFGPGGMRRGGQGGEQPSQPGR